MKPTDAHCKSDPSPCCYSWFFCLRRVIALREPVSDAQGRDVPFLPNLLKDREEDVAAFLEAKHPDRHHIFRFCEQSAVATSDSPFSDGPPTTYFPVDDSSPPSLDAIGKFCDRAASWLRKPSNVAVVQCRDGVGISGVVICCFLLSQGLFETPDRALAHFRRMRLRNTTDSDTFDRNPSFARFISYFFDSVRRPSKALCVETPHPIRVIRAQVAGLADARDASLAIWIRPRGSSDGKVLDRVWLLTTPWSTAARQFSGKEQSGRTLVKSRKDEVGVAAELLLCNGHVINDGTTFVLLPRCPVELDGDLKIQVFSGAFRRSKVSFTAWLNTSFTTSRDGVFLPSEELDRKPSARSPSLDLMFEPDTSNTIGDRIDIEDNPEHEWHDLDA